MPSDVLAVSTSVPHTQIQLASAGYPSREGHDGSVIPKEGIQATSICPSGKDDAQTLSTSSTDEKVGIPNDVTCRATDPPLRQSTRMADERLEEIIHELDTRVKKLESGAVCSDSLTTPEESPTHQTPMTVATQNDNNPAQRDEETNPPRHLEGTTQDPPRSNPTTNGWLGGKCHTAWIVFCVAIGLVSVHYLLQGVYAVYTNFGILRNCRIWWYAVHDWCFANDTCRTKVSALLEDVDVVVVTISALCSTVETTWFHALDTITPWLLHILAAETIILCCPFRLPTSWVRTPYTDADSSVRPAQYSNIETI